MIAKHLFIFKDKFAPDEQTEGGAQSLAAKYGTKSYSTTAAYIDGQLAKIITDGKGCTQSTDPAKAKSGFPNRVGVYLITHTNYPFTLAESGATIAYTICDYLDSRRDLDINCTMLDKLVLVTCAGAERLKKDFYKAEEITKIKLKPHNPDSQKYFATRYAEVSKPWNEKRQKALDESVGRYKEEGEKYLKEKKDNTKVMLACALD